MNHKDLVLDRELIDQSMPSYDSKLEVTRTAANDKELWFYPDNSDSQLRALNYQ